MPDPSKESRVLLAVKAIQMNPNLSVRQAAIAHNVASSTVHRRLTGLPSQLEKKNGPSSLTKSEEEVLVQYILKLDSRGFSPRRVDVEDMANLLLSKHNSQQVGKCWTDRFILRRPELKTRFSRAYDYERAKREDPDVLNAWFSLFLNMKEKFAIHDGDLYNFDETGFAMGIIQSQKVITRSDRLRKPKAIQPGNKEWVTAICAAAADGHVVPPFLCVTGRYHLASWYQNSNIPSNWVIKTTPNGWTDHATGLDWLHHFDRCTATRQKGKFRMLVLDGHESHINAEFTEYCESKHIVPLCLPAHSSHLTQPLDVGLFAPLKKAYCTQICSLMRANITHITKVDFFAAFKAAFSASFTEKNVKGGFRGTGLVPFDPDVVLSQLDIKPSTPPPTTPSSSTPAWVSQTPHTEAEAVSQSSLIKGMVTERLDTSPTAILKSVDQLTKGLVTISHQMTLMAGELETLRGANAALSKRRTNKRTRLQDSGTLTGQQGSQLLVEKRVAGEIIEGEEAGEGVSQQPKSSARLCSICRRPGHNKKNCPQAAPVNSA